MFIYLHVLLEVAVYAEFTYEVFGFCREMDTTLISLSVPYILLVIKSVFFYLCIKRDPGELRLSDCEYAHVTHRMIIGLWRLSTTGIISVPLLSS